MGRYSRILALAGSSSGRAAGSYTHDVGVQRRRRNLITALAAGRIDEQDLSDDDFKLVGAQEVQRIEEARHKDEGGSFLGIGGPIGTSLSNFFGQKGLVGFAQGLPGGLYHIGKNIADEAIHGGHGLASGDPLGGPLGKNVVKPIAEQYKRKYSGSPGDIIHKALVEDPFGTVLDVGTVLTGGAGAAAKGGGLVSKTGRAIAHAGERAEAPSLMKIGANVQEQGRRLTHFGTPTMRRPHIREGAPPIERGRQARGALARIGQTVLDRAAESKLGRMELPGTNIRGIGNFTALGKSLAETQANLAARGIITRVTGRANILEIFAKTQHGRPIAAAIDNLSENQRIALSMLARGVNMQKIKGVGLTFVDQYKRVLDASLKGELPQGFNVVDPGIKGLGADPKYVQHLRQKLDDPEVMKLIENPDQQMIQVSDLWDDEINRNLEKFPIPEEDIQRGTYGHQQVLRTPVSQLETQGNRIIEKDAIRDPARAVERYAEREGTNLPIRPKYVPDELAEGTFRYDKRAGAASLQTPNRNVRTIASRENRGVPNQAFLLQNDFRVFLSGALRVDGGELLGLITRRERAIASRGVMDELVDKLGVRGHTTDEAGNVEQNLLVAKNNEDMRVVLTQAGIHNADEYELLPVEEMKNFFGEETNHLAEVVQAIEKLKEENPRLVGAKEQAVLKSANDLMETNAEIAVTKMLGRGQNQPMPIVRKHDGQYIRDTLNSMQAGGVYRWLMNKWRAMVLVYTPRWWLNTAVGSAVLALLHGALRPKYLGLAKRYGPEAEGKLGRAARHLIPRRYWGNAERNAKITQVAPEHQPGLFGSEQIQISAEGGQRGTGPLARVTHRAFSRAESIESYFKRAGLFKAMDSEAKFHAREIGEVIDGQTAWGLTDEAIQDMIERPRLVNHAVNEMNRFYYNFAELGAFERRFIRNAVPFWGWYKFATKLVWRLPLGYPGRSDVIDKLGDTFRESTEDELGKMPPWMRGSIFLNTNAAALDYISTYGINPLSTFVNPFGERGMGGAIEAAQFSPAIQAAGTAFGLDPFKGEAVDISPESQFQEGLFGRVLNLDTGREVEGGYAGASPGRRLLGGLLRSIPFVRELEGLQAGGRGVYPESIPGLDVRPLPMDPNRPGALPPFQEAIRSLSGIQYHPDYDLKGYQDWLRTDLGIARGRRRSRLQDLMRSGVIR